MAEEVPEGYAEGEDPIGADTLEIPPDKFLVFDIGSCSTKIGYAGEDYPSVVFDTVCGQPLQGDVWSFDKSVIQDAKYRLRKPLEFGSIRDWEAWEELVSECYLKLGEDPSQQPVFMTEPQKNPRENRERTVFTMFENFDVPAFYMASQAVLALYASHNESGTVIHVGDGTADVIPYLYGEARYLKHASTDFMITGSDITDQLAMLLGREKDYSLFTRTQREYLRDLKESLCYVARDYEKEANRARVASKKIFDVSYQLPNRQFVEVGAEKFMAPEILFKPNVDSKGLHEVVVEAIKKCDLVTRFELYQDIVLVGGTTMIPGFRERLEDELKKVAPNAPIRIHEDPMRHLLPWKGASFVTQIPAFQDSGWISRSEFQEFGEQIVHRKCNMN